MVMAGFHRGPTRLFCSNKERVKEALNPLDECGKHVASMEGICRKRKGEHASQTVIINPFDPSRWFCWRCFQSSACDLIVLETNHPRIFPNIPYFQLSSTTGTGR